MENQPPAPPSPQPQPPNSPRGHDEVWEIAENLSLRDVPTPPIDLEIIPGQDLCARDWHNRWCFELLKFVENPRDEDTETALYLLLDQKYHLSVCFSCRYTKQMHDVKCGCYPPTDEPLAFLYVLDYSHTLISCCRQCSDNRVYTCGERLLLESIRNGN